MMRLLLLAILYTLASTTQAKKSGGSSSSDTDGTMRIQRKCEDDNYIIFSCDWQADYSNKSGVTAEFVACDLTVCEPNEGDFEKRRCTTIDLSEAPVSDGAVGEIVNLLPQYPQDASISKVEASGFGASGFGSFFQIEATVDFDIIGYNYTATMELEIKEVEDSKGKDVARHDDSSIEFDC